MKQRKTAAGAAREIRRQSLGLGLAVFAIALAVLALAEYLLPASRQVAMVGVALVLAVAAAGLAELLIGGTARKLATAKAPRAASPQDAMIDTLTRLPNRRAISVHLLESMAHADRYGVPVSAALLDIDALRKLSEQHGRKAGDRVLQGVAGLLAEMLRVPDRAGRYSEGEFVVVMPHTNLKNAARIAERLRGAVNAAEFGDGRPLKVTASLGVAQYHPGEDLQQFIARVDQAVSAAKKAGRNRVAADRG